MFISWNAFFTVGYLIVICKSHGIGQSIVLDYNVFYPRSCSDTKCSLGVGWSQSNESNWINLTLMAANIRGDAVWAAVGFSENSRMSNSDVLTCWYYNNDFQLFNAWNTDIGYNCILDENQNIIQFFSANYTDGILTCNFSRMKILNETEKDKSLDRKWHILLAWGHLHVSSVGKPKMLQHAVQYSTACKCNVTNFEEPCLCIQEFKKLLLHLHEAIMAIVFILLLPTGAFISTFYRNILVSSWYQSHTTLMVSGMIGMVAGLGFVLGHTGGAYIVGPHQVIGVITLGFTALQVLVAVFRPSKSSSLRRKLFEFFHRFNAILVLILGYLSLFLGSWLHFVKVKRFFAWMETIIALSILCSLLFVAVMVIVKFVAAKVPPVQYHKLSEGSDTEEVISVESPSIQFQHTKQRALLVGFILQSFALAGLVSAFVFYSGQFS